ncbi:MAG: type IV pilin N-terminal domain-containing protein [Candidatus Hadarchaeales archaeon]
MRPTSERGVSPVVGVILLIAITVTLVGIVATLVGGLGGKGTPPTINIQVRARSGPDNQVLLTLIHNGGDSVSLADLIVKAGDDETSLGENRALGTGLFSVGSSIQVWVKCPTDYRTDNIIAVCVIHKPSNQMILPFTNVTVEAS